VEGQGRRTGVDRGGAKDGDEIGRGTARRKKENEQTIFCVLDGIAVNFTPTS
jgi:hypothetical protein